MPLACLIGGLSVSAGVALTATSGWLIVQASTRPVILTLLVAIVGVRAFGLARPVLRYAERVLSHDVALGELVSRRADLFAGLIPLTPARLGRRSRGQLLTAVVRDLDDVVDEQVRVTVPLWSGVIASAIGAAIAAWHVPAAGVAVVVGSLAISGIGLLGLWSEKAAADAAVEARGQVQHRVTALTSRLLDIQAVTGRTGAPDHLLTPIADAEDTQHRAEARLVAARALALAAAWAVVAASTAVVVVLAWTGYRSGDLSGPYAALVALLPMALADTWVGVADIAGAGARARSAASRLDTILGQDPAVHEHGGDEPPATGVPELSLHAVTASWAPRPSTGHGVPMDLAPIDLDLAPGSRVVLTGPNGIGKSTVLAVLARQLDPATGTYQLDGADVRRLDLHRTRDRIAVVDDEPHAFAGSVRANLALAAPAATDPELRDALGTVDLAHWFSTLPQGLDTPLAGLSGGERARLSLARALLSRRPVVLLDEPAAHLDEATATRALTGLLAAAGDGTSYVLVSHGAPAPGPWEEVRLRATGVETAAAHA